MKKRKLKQMVKIVADKVENHTEFIRYMWPDKTISSRFKLLNFLSADWLRHDINSLRSEIHMIRIYLEAVSRCPDEVTQEQYKKAVGMALKYTKRSEEAAEGLFHV